MSEGYSLRDVTRLLGLSRSIVGGLIGAGYVSPSRGPRREYRFSFQDLGRIPQRETRKRIHVIDKDNRALRVTALAHHFIQTVRLVPNGCGSPPIGLYFVEVFPIVSQELS